MKWTMAEEESGKVARVSKISLHRVNRRRFLSALISYSVKKRKLANGESEKPSGHQILLSTQNTDRNTSDSHQMNKLRSSLNKEELSSIQTQLAILSDGDGDRPIHIAVANENLRLVQKLGLLMVKNSISLDITNYLRQTPLHLAVILGNIDIIKMLFDFGASPSVSDRKGNSVLHLAVKSSCKDEVFHTLFSHTQIKSLLNSMDYEGYSPLHYAVFQNNSNAVQVLHSYGVDINKIDGKSGRTPLIHAVLEENTEMVHLLLKCGACPQKVDYSGRSALEMALQVANVHIVKLLEKRMPQTEFVAVKDKPATQHSTARKNKRTKSQNSMSVF